MVYDHVLYTKKFAQHYWTDDICYRELDEIVFNKNPGKSKIVVLLDEAQALLENEALSFRRILWWLRVKRREEVVAIFTGTTTEISQYYRDTSLPLRPRPPASSREARAKTFFYRNELEYNLSVYPPCYDLTTIGCLVPLIGIAEINNFNNSKQAKSDYDVAALYGQNWIGQKINVCNVRRVIDKTYTLLGFHHRKAGYKSNQMSISFGY
jgi:hypothetical protein